MDGYAFRTILSVICPDYVVDFDNDGQLIIYTHLQEDDDDNYIKMKEVM